MKKFELPNNEDFPEEMPMVAIPIFLQMVLLDLINLFLDTHEDQSEDLEFLKDTTKNENIEEFKKLVEFLEEAPIVGQAKNLRVWTQEEDLPFSNPENQKEKSINILSEIIDYPHKIDENLFSN